MNTTCTTVVLPTRRPLLQRWWLWLGQMSMAWRARTRLNAELRALQGLSDATLRDIGMAERVVRQPALSATDYERGIW